MSLDERFFGWLMNSVTRRPGKEQLARRARRFAVEGHIDRIRKLVSAISGESTQVALVDGVGGLAGRVVLVPRFIDDAPTSTENEQQLLLFATLSGWRLRHPSKAQSHDSDSRDVLQLRALLHVRSLEPSLGLEFPGYALSRGALNPRLLADRPLPALLNGRDAVLEHLTRLLLGDPNTDDARPEIAGVVSTALSMDHPDQALIRAFEKLKPLKRFVPPAIVGTQFLSSQGTQAVAQDASDLPQSVTSEREGKQRGAARHRRKLLAMDQQQNPLTHSFEKVHTVEEYKGGRKQADGSDELNEHGAALDEIDLEETVLSSERTQSVYRAGDAIAEWADAPESRIGGLSYDEWDARHHRYLANYCQLQVFLGKSDVGLGRDLVARVVLEQHEAMVRTRAALKQVKEGLRWRTRQLDGSEVDVDAAVDRMTSLAAGHEGAQRVYAQRRRSARELAVLILIDTSLSTDSWVDNRRVLEVEREAATILAMATEGLVDEFGIAAFSSDTHEACRFIEVCRIHEDWRRGVGRLAALEPAGYTRIGPAIRHAALQLSECRAKRRLLVVLTDGKPSDRDRYEGRYGEADVRQAVREAARESVHVLALGVDPGATSVLRAMFGREGTAGLTEPHALANAITRTVTRRTRS